MSLLAWALPAFARADKAVFPPFPGSRHFGWREHANLAVAGGRSAKFEGDPWCRGWESNPHAPCGAQDFKSRELARSTALHCASSHSHRAPTRFIVLRIAPNCLGHATIARLEARSVSTGAMPGLRAATTSRHYAPPKPIAWCALADLANGYHRQPFGWNAQRLPVGSRAGHSATSNSTSLAVSQSENTPFRPPAPSCPE